LVGREVLETLDLTIEVMCEDEAAEPGNFNSKVISFVLVTRYSKKRQRHASPRIPPRFDSGELGRLVVAWIQALRIADDHLEWYQYRQQPEGHRQHDATFFDAAAASNEVGASSHHDEAGRSKEGNYGVCQTIGE